MLTGRLAVRSGTYTALEPPNDEYFRVFYPSSEGCTDPSEVTVAEVLREAGYATSLVGKWHNGHRIDIGCLPGDGRRGFEYFFGIPYSHEEGWPGPFPEGLIWPPVPLYENGTIVEQPFNGTDLVSRYTERAVAQMAAAAASSKPFFLHVAYEAPHVPLFVAPAFANVSRRGFFGDAVQEMDDSVGQIMEWVRTNAPTSTLVIFTSDNGAWLHAGSGLSAPAINARSGIGPFDGGSNGPLFEGKGSTWEGGVRVPLVAWWPGQISPGAVSMATASGLDFLPTMAALAGAVPPAGLALDGKDMGPALFQGDDFGPWYGDYMFFWRESKVYAVRHGRYKVHYVTRSGFNVSDLGTAQDPPLVFDVESDPGEASPVDSDPATCSPEVRPQRAPRRAPFVFSFSLSLPLSLSRCLLSFLSSSLFFPRARSRSPSHPPRLVAHRWWVGGRMGGRALWRDVAKRWPTSWRGRTRRWRSTWPASGPSHPPSTGPRTGPWCPAARAAPSTPRRPPPTPRPGSGGSPSGTSASVPASEKKRKKIRRGGGCVHLRPALLAGWRGWCDGCKGRTQGSAHKNQAKRNRPMPSTFKVVGCQPRRLPSGVSGFCQIGPELSSFRCKSGLLLSQREIGLRIGRWCSVSFQKGAGNSTGG